MDDDLDFGAKKAKVLILFYCVKRCRFNVYAYSRFHKALTKNGRGIYVAGHFALLNQIP